MLDPRSTNWLEGTFFDLALDAVEDRGLHWLDHERATLRFVSAQGHSQQFGGIDITDVLLCDLSAFSNRLIASIGSDEGVHDGIANLESFMLLPGILRELPGSISNDPEVDEQSSCFKIDSYDIGFLQLEVPVWTRWLDAVSSRGISEHAVASHLDVEDMFLAVTERLRENPLDTLASSGKTFEVPGALRRLEKMERTEVVRAICQHIGVMGEQPGEGAYGSKPWFLLWICLPTGFAAIRG
ncbi:putative alpha-mannosidase I, partial [Aureobasidium melanogenum]